MKSVRSSEGVFRTFKPSTSSNRDNDLNLSDSFSNSFKDSRDISDSRYHITFSHKELSRPSSRNNSMKDIKHQLTDLKTEVKRMTNTEESENLVESQVVGEVFFPDFNKRPASRRMDLEYKRSETERQNEDLRAELKLVKAKYLCRKSQYEKEVMLLQRGLEEKERMFERSVLEYRDEVEEEMGEIRRSLVMKAQNDPYRKLSEENLTLCRRVIDLSSELQESKRKILEMESIANLYKSQVRQEKENVSRLSSIRADSNIFNLSNSLVSIDFEKEELLATIVGLREHTSRQQQSQIEADTKFRELLRSLEEAKQALNLSAKDVDQEKQRRLHYEAEIQQLNEHLSIVSRSNQELVERLSHLQGQSKKAEECRIVQSVYPEISSSESTTATENSQLKETISTLKSQVSCLKKELQEVTRGSSDSHSTEVNALKKNLEEKSRQLREREKKTYLQEAEVQNMRTEVDITNRKMLSERKQLVTTSQIQANNLRTEVSILKQVNESLNDKVRVILADTRRKEEFIHKHLLGKNLSEAQKFDLEGFFSQYRFDFPETYLRDSIFKETKIIQQLRDTP